MILLINVNFVKMSNKIERKYKKKNQNWIKNQKSLGKTKQNKIPEVWGCEFTSEGTP